MKKYIDLTVPLTAGMTMHDQPLYCGVPITSEIIRISSPEMPGQGSLSSTKIIHSVHQGSHMDAQEHQIAWGHQIADYPIGNFIGDALVIDWDPSQLITAEDLERRYGKKMKGIKILLFRQKKEAGAKEEDELRGGLTLDAIAWCATHGITAMNAPTASGVGRAYFAYDIVGLSNLQNLEKITKERVFVVALPMLIIPSEAAPMRIVAIEDEENEGEE